MTVKMKIVLRHGANPYALWAIAEEGPKASWCSELGHEFLADDVGVYMTSNYS